MKLLLGCLSRLSLLAFFLLGTAAPLCAQAQAYSDGEMSMRDHFYSMITGGFGTLLIIFLGLGGAAFLLMTRQGKSANQAPILGVVMLLAALALFVFRVMIISGVLGFEYLEY